MTRPSERAPGGVRHLTDAEAPDFLEATRFALLAFLDLDDAASQRMAARLAVLAARHERPDGAFAAAIVDVRGSRLVADALGVTSVPTLVLFVDGALVERLVGVAPEAVLDAMLRERVS